ncbi:hypothetical protein FDP41_011721 [Naegleria fowleri]|uniref:BTB domain-containing protein n=1 Tax=Naegleria fowleri TaxID=5763 RepID=A0A6A5C7U1_NAEFO|nr:uncharacterized protein FDP41_011721 [Naegleria fowleri]KAF0981860.1 hypothetical protein FDP41_011721 [Naegleria fowleri]
MSTILSVGFGGFGGLALNQLHTQTEPKESSALSLINVRHISVGLWHSMIVTNNGKLFGVGRNRYGALGIGEPESLDQLNYTLPVEVQLPKEVKVIKACAGKTHSIALTDDGTLFSFGFGIACGHGHTTLTGVPEPVQYLFSYRVVDCSAGEGHSAAVTEDGKLFTWGLANRIKPVMVKSKAIDDEFFVQVVCGAYHGIALTATGKLFGYGKNDDGQVNGISTTGFISEESIEEIKHPLGEGYYWTQVSCGLKQTIALDHLGNVYIWGFIKDGVISMSGDVKGPTLVHLSHSSSKVKKIMSGYSSFAILTQDGKCHTWGYNLHYNLGHGHNKFVQQPTLVESLSAVAINDVFMGAYNVFISCGLSATTDYSRLLHENSYFADCKLRASNGDEQVCHSCIVSARSPYLPALLFKNHVNKNQLSTSSAKFSSDKLKEEIDNALTLDFVEDRNQLLQILDFLYTNLSNNIMHPKKFDDIFNSYLFNTEKSIEILKSLTNLEEENKLQAQILIDFIKNQMTHETLKTFSKCASGSIPEYSRDLVNLYSTTTELVDCKQLSVFTRMSDVLFQLDDDTTWIHSHKAILCCRSEYFRAMFSIGQFLESSQKVIHLDHTPKDVFEILLKFIYTGEEISEETITAEQSVPLLELATRFNVETVKLAAERKIIRFLTPSNVVPMCSVADMCQALNVKKCCMHLIAKHFKTYQREDLERDLDPSLMEEIETLHREYRKAAESQSANEEAVFNYMREQQEAAESLLDNEHRQHLVNEYDDDDMDMIQTILHGSHNPHNPVHAPFHRHNSRNNSSQKKNCLFM